MTQDDLDMICEALMTADGQEMSKNELEFQIRFFCSTLDLQRACMRDNGATDVGAIHFFMNTDVVHETPPMNYDADPR